VPSAAYERSMLGRKCEGGGQFEQLVVGGGSIWLLDISDRRMAFLQHLPF
jgi:hypothetical protein